MEKPTILFFEDSSKTLFGGGQEISLLVLQALKDKFKINVFDFSKSSIFLDQVHSMGIDSHHLFGYGRIVNHQHQSFSCGFLEIMLFPFFLILNLLQLIKFIFLNREDKKPPILFCATKKVLILAVLISPLLNGKVIFYALNVNTPKRITGFVFNQFLKRCDLILGLSQTVCNKLPFAAELLYSAAPPELSSTIRKLTCQRRIHVAVFAALQKWKGIDYFIESFHVLKHQKQVVYWICGEGPEMKALQQISNGNPDIIFKGFQKFSDISQDVDIVVLPSIQPEALGMNIIKAMHSGIPVIATEIGAHVELIEDNQNGFIVPPENSLEIARKIDSLIDNPEIYSQLSKAGIDFAKRFDFSNFKRKLIEYI